MVSGATRVVPVIDGVVVTAADGITHITVTGVDGVPRTIPALNDSSTLGVMAGLCGKRQRWELAKTFMRLLLVRGWIRRGSGRLLLRLILEMSRRASLERRDETGL
jgi:hypothetical protein